MKISKPDSEPWLSFLVLPNKRFVSRYALEIPEKEAIERFLTEIGKELGYESL